MGSLVTIFDRYSISHRDPFLGMVMGYYGKTPERYLYTYDVFFLSGAHAGRHALVHVGIALPGSKANPYGAQPSGQFAMIEIISDD